MRRGDRARRRADVGIGPPRIARCPTGRVAPRAPPGPSAEPDARAHIERKRGAPSARHHGKVKRPPPRPPSFPPLQSQTGRARFSGNPTAKRRDFGQGLFPSFGLTRRSPRRAGNRRRRRRPTGAAPEENPALSRAKISAASAPIAAVPAGSRTLPNGARKPMPSGNRYMTDLDLTGPAASALLVSQRPRRDRQP